MSLDRFSLTDRVALVTGGSRGIGRSISLALASSGARVAVVSRRLDACEAVAQSIRDGGGEALACSAHAGREPDVRAAVAVVMERWGRLDILVNNAATNPEFGPVLDSSEAAFDKTVAVNLKGPWMFSQQAVRAWMGDHGGSIINVASIGGIRPEPLLGVYNATKAALINLTKTMAKELGSRGVRVNAIAPGLIRTDFARMLVETPELRDRFLATSALQRVGEPDEMTGAVVWLASDASSYVTGSVVVLDGG